MGALGTNCLKLLPIGSLGKAKTRAKNHDEHLDSSLFLEVSSNFPFTKRVKRLNFESLAC